MQNFADKLIEAIKEKGNPCIIGLDPRMELIPQAFFSEGEDKTKNELIEDSIFEWAERLLHQSWKLAPWRACRFESYALRKTELNS